MTTHNVYNLRWTSPLTDPKLVRRHPVLPERKSAPLRLAPKVTELARLQSRSPLARIGSTPPTGMFICQIWLRNHCFCVAIISSHHPSLPHLWLSVFFNKADFTPPPFYHRQQSIWLSFVQKVSDLFVFHL